MRRRLAPFVLGAVALAVAAGGAGAAGFRLAAWKDDLFKYPAVISSKDDGAYVVVDYNQKRDLDDRDIVPEKQTKPEYVDLSTKKVEQDMTLTDGATKVQFIGVGKVQGKAKIVVIYVHGRNGNRFQGANDGMFGGNFNRIKNLMVRNGGVYLSPGLPDLGAPGARQVKALVKQYAENSPGAPIFIACGSLGGQVCWALAKDPEVAPLLGGLLLMGSTHDDGFLKSAAFKARQFPIYLGHGSHDIILNWKGQAGFYAKVKKAAPDYPIRFALFQSGSHGTPIRMTDWRMQLNWMLQVDGK
ncbi:MAG: alpha/beta hydrolase [Rhizobiales bacterium]|nr:alpha/beta hydrolase [Hyphomicrobiales bacterium]MBN9008796.1 alpha/beta hydrolase [Hyphomicrobiales bacterium]